MGDTTCGKLIEDSTPEAAFAVLICWVVLPELRLSAGAVKKSLGAALHVTLNQPRDKLVQDVAAGGPCRYRNGSWMETPMTARMALKSSW
jgi:hypothetical protein